MEAAGRVNAWKGLNEIMEDLSANNGAGGGRQANAQTQSSDDPFGG